MTVQQSQPASPDERPRVCVSLTGVIGLRDCADLRDRFLGAFEAGLDVEIDARAVERVDFGAVQLVAAARRTAAERGVGLSLAYERGGPFEETLRATGFLPADGGAGVPDGFWLGEGCKA